MRGDGGFSQFIGDGKRDLERKAEDYFKNELVNVEKSVVDDVEIDIGKSVAQAANKLEVKAGRKAKKAVVQRQIELKPELKAGRRLSTAI